MLKRIRMVVVLCAALCAAFALSGCDMLKQETYTPALKDAAVSSPTIGQDGTLRVGVNTGNPPLAGMVSNRIVGLDVDIAAAIADELGLKLSIVDTGSNPASALESGSVDIVMGVDSSDTALKFWKSEDYLPMGAALFASTSTASAPDANSNPTFAAQVSSKSAWAVMNAFGDATLTSTSNLKEAFSQLASGSVQYVAADAVIGVYAAHGDGVAAYIVATLQETSGYCVGVSSSNTALQNAVGSAVQKLVSNGTISVIEKKWLGTNLNLDGVPMIEAPEEEETTEGEEGAEGEEAAADGEEAAAA